MAGRDAASTVRQRLAWLQALHQPDLVRRWSLDEWQHIIRLSRRLRLAGRLAEAISTAGLDETVPDPARRLLLAESRSSRWRLRVLNWTIERIGTVLAPMPQQPFVLLKGAAYVAQGLPIAAGRLPSDLDLMVPKDTLAAVQRQLASDDWASAVLDDHDRRYYEDWSHEVPPMHHPQLAMELDLHHAILPPVARTAVDSALLFERSVPVDAAPWRVLCPVDQVLHSAAHLFFDSELRDRVRDLVDLDGLLRHFGRWPGFWDDLEQRAQQLGLTEPLALACHYVEHWLGTPLPRSLRVAMARRGPQPARRAWLLPLLDAVLEPTDPDQRPSRRQNFAATALLARYHAQRMPLRLLLPHLWHKARKRRGADEGDDQF